MRQVLYVLLTRSPLSFSGASTRKNFARLACIRHAASVRPEPGSNSPTTTHTAHTAQKRVSCTKQNKNKINSVSSVYLLTRATHPYHHRRGVRHPHNNTSVWVCVVLGTLLSSHTTKKRHCQRFSRCPLIFYVGLRVEE